MFPSIALLCCLPLFASTEWPADVESALMFAGPNRVEIERALQHYADGDDPQKLDALCFLVANMPGHGYVTYGLFDAAGNEVPFEALDYPSYKAAQDAYDALEAEHGPLDFKKTKLVEDLTVLTADGLIENVDLAFRAWRTDPWAADMTFETFCESVLPYRGSNEPVEAWRGPLMQQVAEMIAELEDAEPAKVAGIASRLASRTVGFSELYYLHPTDQGFAEMSSARRGRCEDITNMTTYAMRAACVASAADYTPWWAHRDNNHAWPVVLDGAGRGSAGDGNRAAKVYRKTYAKQKDNLCFQLKDGEEAPPWLDRATYRDVTDQYFEVHDVHVPLAGDASHRFAYLCVFNGGEWRPIHWGRVADGAAHFDKMHGGLLYLPAFYADGRVVPAAAPFFLAPDGRVERLAAGTQAGPAVTLPTKAGVGYELFAWRDAWASLGRVEGVEGGVARPDLPAGALFWLVADGSRRLERPFRVVDGEIRSL